MFVDDIWRDAADALILGMLETNCRYDLQVRIAGFDRRVELREALIV